MNLLFFFFKRKTAYELRISDWISDVCSSDLARRGASRGAVERGLCLAAQRGVERGRAARSDRGPAWRAARCFRFGDRSEERRVGKSVSVSVDLGGSRIIKKK